MNVSEKIHIQNAYKYSVEELQVLVKEAGFYPTNIWTDANQLYSIHYSICRYEAVKWT